MITLPTEILYGPPSQELRFLPEGPYPLGENRFSWVAIQHGANASVGSVNVFDLNTHTNTSYTLPGRPGFAFPTDRGNFVVGCEREVGIFSPKDGSWKPFLKGIDDQVQVTIINDGITWNGNLIFGTKDLEFKTKKAGLYFWRASDQKLFTLRNDQICSNGKCVLPLDDQRIELLDIDSPTRRVVSYCINTDRGVIESERTIVDLANDDGVPDGMTMTPDRKSIIVSLYNPTPSPMGRTVQFGISSGIAEKTWTTQGSPQATCPQWICYQGRACLLITTAVEHMPAERRDQSPEAGTLFIAKTEIGWDEDAFASLTPPFLE